MHVRFLAELVSRHFAGWTDSSARRVDRDTRTTLRA
jgi:hypothetical protein